MTDLAARLLAAIEETERIARHLDEHLSGHDRPYNPGDPTDPAVASLLCAVHREIVQMHSDQHECAGGANAWAYPYVGCDTLLALAKFYRLSTDDPATED